MRHIDPKDTPVKDVFRYLLGGVAPRPIALVSTVSKSGDINLAPFSFFGAFGANPPTVAFSPSRRLRDTTVKDTYNNIRETNECVIQVVTHSMVHQVNLASAEFPPDVNEFIKSGLTQVASDLVNPPRVAESPFQMECKVAQLIELGNGGASGNLLICEVMRFHIADEIIVEDAIDPKKIDLVARMGGDWYCRANGDALFELPKPSAGEKIGFDNLPEYVLNSKTLTANNLGQLAGYDHIPGIDEAQPYISALAATLNTNDNPYLHDCFTVIAEALEKEKHSDCRGVLLFDRAAKLALDEANDVRLAWNLLAYAHR